MAENLDQQALDYHRNAPPGKIRVMPSKPLSTQRDLALAYSPGVAAACREIEKNPADAALYTARGNLVAVISNGTAVLGLGAIGPLASKPVMEGKGVLFRKFAGIDVFDIEVDERDPQKFIDIVASLEPTFGGINLEDIKAPECFEIEERLRERMNIPVFHDDQHGTAIVTAAAVLNGLQVIGKRIEEVRLVCSGAGAAAQACLDLLVGLGLPRDNMLVCDRDGVIRPEREAAYDARKARFAQSSAHATLNEAITGADIFLGLSGPGTLSAQMVERMAERPLILALANPEPEILPEEALAARPDAVLATGRSDYPNQVNNVLCFPFLFRGALDVGATEINEEMKLASVRAIAALARSQPPDVVRSAYGGETLSFGEHYLIPKPFDPRLILHVAPAVARAAMDSGVATRPITDFNAYINQLEDFVFRSGSLMKPLIEAARSDPQRVVYAEGENERVLEAAGQVIEEGLARPILVGRSDVIQMRIERLGLKLVVGENIEVINTDSDPRYSEFWRSYAQIMQRRGVSPEEARTRVRTRNTLIAALALRHGYADALVCGVEGRFNDHLRYLLDVIGTAPGCDRVAAASILMLGRGTFFVTDTHVNPDPSAEEIAAAALLCTREVRRFGMEPKVALLSHSNFGSGNQPSPRKMRRARELLAAMAPDLEVEGEMHADMALVEASREKRFPDSCLSGSANLLVMPNLDAANIVYHMFRALGDGVVIGPVMMGLAAPAHVLNSSASVRRILNMTAIATVQAQAQAQKSTDNPGEQA